MYYGIDKNSRKEIAIKFSKNKEKIIDYDREKHILEILKSKDFYPKNIFDESNIEKNFLCLSLLGPNLFELYKMCDKNFDRKTLINIFTGIAHEIEYISSKSVVHCDIKPENICWGSYENSKLIDLKNIFLIDFGLSYDFTYKI